MQTTLHSARRGGGSGVIRTIGIPEDSADIGEWTGRYQDDDEIRAKKEKTANPYLTSQHTKARLAKGGELDDPLFLAWLYNALNIGDTSHSLGGRPQFAIS